MTSWILQTPTEWPYFQQFLHCGMPGFMLASSFNPLNSEFAPGYRIIVTNFIQLVPLQPVDRFSQTKLHWKAPNEGYPHICGMYKSNNKWLRYQAISSCKSFICQYLMNSWTDSHDWTCVRKCSSTRFQRYMIHLKTTSIGRDTSISM